LCKHKHLWNIIFIAVLSFLLLTGRYSLMNIPPTSKWTWSLYSLFQKWGLSERISNIETVILCATNCHHYGGHQTKITNLYKTEIETRLHYICKIKKRRWNNQKLWIDQWNKRKTEYLNSEYRMNMRMN